jgi:hypothetical protein
MNSTVNAPVPIATTMSWATVSQPSAQATGTVASNSARPRSAAMSTGRRRTRSAQAPAGSPMTSHATDVAAATRLTWNVEAASVVTATSGSASVVIADPSSLIDWPAHSNAKSRLRVRLRTPVDPAMTQQAIGIGQRRQRLC